MEQNWCVTMAYSNNTSILKTPTVLEQLLEEINFQRTKEMRQLMKDGKSKQCSKIHILTLVFSCRIWICNVARDNILDRLVCQAFSISKWIDHRLWWSVVFCKKKHIKGSPRYLPKFEVSISNTNLLNSIVIFANLCLLINS